MLYLCYLCRFKPLRDHLRGFLIAAWAGDKIAEFSFPEISFHFPLRPWFFFVSPAYAGKSHSYLNSTFLNLGSPPRMRGKERYHFAICEVYGITPAYAGKRGGQRALRFLPQDHPRVCGEKQRGVKDMKAAGGSPPRMRGKAEQQQSPVHLQRITPAYAGKSSLRGSRACSGRDHPRVCGEKAAWFLPCRIDQGSPPRMRGKATVADVPAKSVGITPAYAGKSGFLLFAWSLLRDHPRVCGEKALCTPYGCFTPGSPPRMRGKVVLLGREAL